MEFLPPASNLSLFLAASFILLITPGPNVMYVITRSIDQGRSAGLTSVLGVEVGDAVHVMGAILGVSTILLASALAFDIVKYLGAAYLIFIGLRTLLSRPNEDMSGAVSQASTRHIFTNAVVVAIFNPKTALFFIAFLPQFVEPMRGNVPLQMLVLGVIFLLMATTTNSLYALAAGAAGRWLRGNRLFTRVQRYVAGTVYVALGVTAALVSGRQR
ncbi:MAG: LysE family translocator [Anaerolineae bacterium]|nr:LysE family translocator [Anaerolineae bacterium]